MKKQSIALIILLVLLFSGAIYIYSQNGKAIICFTNTTSSAGAIDRIFEDNSKRKLWIPTGATEIKNDEFTLDECKIKVVHSGGKSNSFSIKYKDIECKSFLLAYPSNQENIILVKLEIPRATNLLTIVNNYFKQKHIETTTNKIGRAHV